MLKMIGKKLKDQRGLTLVELLAVVVILGIIAAIAVPSIGKIVENSKVDAVKADAIQIINAAKIYHTQSPKTPIAITDLNDLIELNTDFTGSVTVTSGLFTFSGTGKKGDTTVTFTNATIKGISDSAKTDKAVTK